MLSKPLISKTHRAQYLYRRNRGFSLLEMVLVLGIAALMSVMLMSMWQTSAERIRAKSVGDKLQIVTEAAKSYVKTNAAALQTLAPINGALVIPIGKTSAAGAIPNGPSGLKSVQGGGFLPVSFIDTNAFGQRTALLVKKNTAGNGLQALVTTYGGRSMPDDMLGHAANSIGALGGYVPTTYIQAADNGMILGNYGGWRTMANQWGPTATRPRAGHLQTTLAFDDSALLADYLYRDDIGIPEANRMNTPIDMNNNDINNVDQIAAGTSGTVEVVGNMRATIDIYARDAHLSRNLNVAGDGAIGGDMDVGRDVNATGDITAETGDITAQTGNLSVKGLGKSQPNTGIATINTLKANYLNTSAIVYGSEVKGANQASVTTAAAQGAAAVTLGDLLPKSVPQYSYLVEDNGKDDVVLKPVCKGGDEKFTRARVMVYPLTYSWQTKPFVDLDVTTANSYVTGVTVADTNNEITTAIVAETSGATSSIWKIKWIGTPQSPVGTRRAIAQTFCYYGGA